MIGGHLHAESGHGTDGTFEPEAEAFDGSGADPRKNRCSGAKCDLGCSDQRRQLNPRTAEQIEGTTVCASHHHVHVGRHERSSLEGLRHLDRDGALFATGDDVSDVAFEVTKGMLSAFEDAGVPVHLRVCTDPNQGTLRGGGFAKPGQKRDRSKGHGANVRPPLQECLFRVRVLR